MTALEGTPGTCPACRGRRLILLAAPGSPLFAVMPCLACVWTIPVVELPMRGDR